MRSPASIPGWVFGCRVEQAKCLAQLAGLVPNKGERERFLLGQRRILRNVIHPFLCEAVARKSSMLDTGNSVTRLSREVENGIQQSARCDLEAGGGWHDLDTHASHSSQSQEGFQFDTLGYFSAGRVVPVSP